MRSIGYLRRVIGNVETITIRAIEPEYKFIIAVEPLTDRWLNAPPPPQVSVEYALQMSGADAVYYGTQMRGVSNAKAKRELNFHPRSLEWMVNTALARAS